MLFLFSLLPFGLLAEEEGFYIFEYKTKIEVSLFRIIDHFTIKNAPAEEINRSVLRTKKINPSFNLNKKLPSKVTVSLALSSRVINKPLAEKYISKQKGTSFYWKKVRKRQKESNLYFTNISIGKVTIELNGEKSLKSTRTRLGFGVKKNFKHKYQLELVPYLAKFSKISHPDSNEVSSSKLLLEFQTNVIRSFTGYRAGLHYDFSNIFLPKEIGNNITLNSFKLHQISMSISFSPIKSLDIIGKLGIVKSLGDITNSGMSLLVKSNYHLSKRYQISPSFSLIKLKSEFSMTRISSFTAGISMVYFFST